MFRQSANLIVLIALLSGCSVHGKWNLTQSAVGTRDAEFRSLWLEKDGTYYAESVSTDRVEPAAGTYSYENGVLSLLSSDGERHSYDADFENSGKELKLKGFAEGKTLELKYRRVND